jgi:hypothetical protein
MNYKFRFRKYTMHDSNFVQGKILFGFFQLLKENFVLALTILNIQKKDEFQIARYKRKVRDLLH